MVTVVNSMFPAVATQVRVMYALLQRDVKMRFRDSPIGPLSAIAEPVAQILMLSLIFSYVRFRAADLGDYIVLFFMTGLLPLFCFRMAMNNTQQTISRHRRTMYAPHVRPMDLIMAGYIFTLCVYITLFAGFNWFFVFIFKAPGAQYFVLCLIPMVCNALIGLGFGIAITVAAIFFSYIRVIVGILFGPVQILSGMFFTAETLPPAALKILIWNTFFHSTELFRTFFYAEYTSPIFSPYYYFGWVITCTALGLVLERVMRHRLLAEAG